MYRLAFAVIVCLSCTVVAHAQAPNPTPEEALASASALFDAHDYAGAAAALDRFLAANPGHASAPTAALALGRCRSALRQYTQAVPAFEKAAATGSGEVATAARLELGEAAVRAGLYDRAVEPLRASTAAALKPEQAALAWYWLGEAQFGLAHYADAEAAYRRVVRDYAASAVAEDAAYAAELSLLRQGSADAARKGLQALVDAKPSGVNRARAMLLIAQIDLRARRLPDARAGFEKLLSEYPPDRTEADLRAAAQDGLIEALLALGDDGAAAPRLEEALARHPAADPDHARAALSLGHCRFRLKQYEPALAAYTEAGRAADAAVAGEALYWAGNALMALGRNGEAAERFRKVAVRYPAHARALRAQLKSGDALRADGRADAGAAAYRAIIQRQPDSPEAAEARQALVETVGADRAARDLEGALKSAGPGETARALVRLARAQVQARRYADAVVLAERALAGRPEPALAAEAQYALGLGSEGLDRAAAAMDAYREAARLAPSAAWMADLQTRLAWLDIDAKRPADAELSAAAALALKPEPRIDEQARLALLQAQVDQQKWEAALAGCRDLLASPRAPETAAAVISAQAWAYEKLDRPNEARAAWERLAAEHATGRYAERAQMHLGDLDLKAGRGDEARARYAAILAAAPTGPVAVEARFKMGSALYAAKRYGEAASQFDAVAQDKQSGVYGVEALYWAGLAFEKAGKPQDAVARLTLLAAQYPNHPRAAAARQRLSALNAASARP